MPVVKSAREWLALQKPYLTHPTIPVVALVAVLFGALAGPRLFTLAGALAFLAGLALFIPQEYVSHRFFLHARPSKRPILRRMQERLHYAHHRDPEDRGVIFGPLWAVLPLAAVYWLLYVAVLRDVALASAISFSGSLAYLWYEHVHYAAHSRIVPLTTFGKRMKASHLWHHHKNEFLWFGVTSPAMDYAVGTHEDVHAAAASPTVKNIEASHPSK